MTENIIEIINADVTCIPGRGTVLTIDKNNYNISFEIGMIIKWDNNKYEIYMIEASKSFMFPSKTNSKISLVLKKYKQKKEKK